MRGRLAPYEYPREIEFIDALPMTTTGKVQRKELRKLEQGKTPSSCPRREAHSASRCGPRAPGGLRSLVQEPLHRARITLVTPHAKQVYSGMLPGLLAGHYRRADAEVDVAALAERAYVELEQGLVERLDLERRRCS